MSKEIIEDFIDRLVEDPIENFPEILDGIIYYGFADDVQLAKLLDVELDDVDELLISSETLAEKTWKSYRVKLRNYLKKEIAKYERLYYKDAEPPRG